MMAPATEPITIPAIAPPLKLLLWVLPTALLCPVPPPASALLLLLLVTALTSMVEDEEPLVTALVVEGVAGDEVIETLLKLPEGEEEEG